MNWAIRGNTEPDDNKQFEWVSVKEYKELTKYKRAFDILKELLSLCKDVSLNGEVDFYTLYFTGELPYECYKRLTKEKYELLEELMKELGN